MDDDKCGTCRFFVSYGTDEGQEEGQCRYDTPTIGGDGKGEWPEVVTGQWCGKFEQAGA